MSRWISRRRDTQIYLQFKNTNGKIFLTGFNGFFFNFWQTTPDETTVASAPPVVNRRRRRRSITNASPARSPSQNKHIAAAHDADGEDNADREDSPEHIYHQIGTDEVVRVSKLPKNTNSQNSSPGGQAGKLVPTTASTVDSDKIIITKNSVSRRPRINLSQGKTK